MMNRVLFPDLCFQLNATKLVANLLAQIVAVRRVYCVFFGGPVESPIHGRCLMEGNLWQRPAPRLFAAVAVYRPRAPA